MQTIYSDSMRGTYVRTTQPVAVWRHPNGVLYGFAVSSSHRDRRSVCARTSARDGDGSARYHRHPWRTGAMLNLAGPSA